MPPPSLNPLLQPPLCQHSRPPLPKWAQMTFIIIWLPDKFFLTPCFILLANYFQFIFRWLWSCNVTMDPRPRHHRPRQTTQHPQLLTGWKQGATGWEQWGQWVTMRGSAKSRWQNGNNNNEEIAHHPHPASWATACGVERGANVRGDLHGCKGGTSNANTRRGTGNANTKGGMSNGVFIITLILLSCTPLVHVQGGHAGFQPESI